jgi:hypothetical protein
MATCSAGQRARSEQLAERFLLRFEQALLRAPAQLELADRGARLARLGVERPQRAVGVGDCDFGSAQRVARFAPAGFPAFELAAQRLDARAQGRQIFFPRSTLRGIGCQEDCSDDETVQTLAFPCAETAAIRFATSSASPR